MMFAGHHTTSVTASWALLELLMHPQWMKVRWSPSSTRSTPTDATSATRRCGRSRCSNAALKETLRLHPPLIILMRKVMYDFHYKGFTVPAGTPSSASHRPSRTGCPSTSRIADRYDPTRATWTVREEDKQTFAWIPFGAGPAPLRGRGLRDDAAEGDLLDPAAPLRVRAGPAARSSYRQRPLEDGRRSAPAVPRALPAPQGQEPCG